MPYLLNVAKFDFPNSVLNGGTAALRLFSILTHLNIQRYLPEISTERILFSIVRLREMKTPGNN